VFWKTIPTNEARKHPGGAGKKVSYYLYVQIPGKVTEDLAGDVANLP
jgi:hypothetical protein